jgi:periplasmic protein CpxP/Spy
MHPTFRLSALTAGLFASLAVADASAASTADTTPRTTSGASARQGADRRMSEADSVEQRITSLRAKLQITAAQEPQWNQFAQVMRDNAKRMDDAFQQRTQGITTMNAEENMASYAQVAAAHAQGMQNLAPAFHALYASMPDIQKRAADQVFRDDAYHGGPGRGRQSARR